MRSLQKINKRQSYGIERDGLKSFSLRIFFSFRENEFKIGIKLFEISYCALEIEAWEGGYFVSSVPRCLHKMQEQFQTILQLVYHHLL